MTINIIQVDLFIYDPYWKLDLTKNKPYNILIRHLFSYKETFEPLTDHSMPQLDCLLFPCHSEIKPPVGIVANSGSCKSFHRQYESR